MFVDCRWINDEDIRLFIPPLLDVVNVFRGLQPTEILVDVRLL